MSRDRYAVIGNPIAHSLSPDIHIEFARQTKQSLGYSRLLAPRDGFINAANTFFAEGGKGLNVTAPFKLDAFNWVDESDPIAEQSGAVNTIVPDGSKYIGYNTDGRGLVRDLQRLSWSLGQANMLILGAGGATRGVLAPMLAEGAKVTVTNRTAGKLVPLAQQFNTIETKPLSEVQDSWDIIINATSLGENFDDLEINSRIFLDSYCYDLAYSRDGRTAFVEKAVREGAQYACDGLGMLVFQAAEAFKLWRGVEPDGIAVLDHLRNTPTIRRFIAGAKCESCGAEDRTFIEKNEYSEVVARGCTSCGFHESADGAKTIRIES